MLEIITYANIAKDEYSSLSHKYIKTRSEFNLFTSQDLAKWLITNNSELQRIQLNSEVTEFWLNTKNSAILNYPTFIWRFF